MVGESLDTLVGKLIARQVGRVVILSRNWVLRDADASQVTNYCRNWGIQVQLGSEFYLIHNDQLITVIGVGYDWCHPRLIELAGESGQYLSVLADRAGRYLETLESHCYYADYIPQAAQDELARVLDGNIAQPVESHLEIIRLICLDKYWRRLLCKDLGKIANSALMTGPEIGDLMEWYSHCPHSDVIPPLAISQAQKVLWRHFFGPGTSGYQGLPKSFQLPELIEVIHRAGGYALLSIEKPGVRTDYRELGLDGICLSMTGSFGHHPESGEPMLPEGFEVPEMTLVGTDYQGLNRSPGIDPALLPEKVRLFCDNLFA